MIQKPYEITLELYNNKILSTQLLYYRGDANAFPITINLNSHLKPYEIPENAQVWVCFTLPTEPTLFNKELATVIDPTNGIIQYNIVGSEISAIGKVYASVEIHMDDKKITWEPFTFTVAENANSTDAIPPVPYKTWTDVIEEEISDLDSRVTVLEEGGGSGAITVPDNYFFTTAAERDQYFTDHPEELIINKTYCVVDSELQLYKTTGWADMSTIVRGPKGDKGDKGEKGDIGPEGPPGPSSGNAYIHKSIEDWTTAPIELTDLLINDLINYQGAIFTSLTGVITISPPDSDTINWKEFKSGGGGGLSEVFHDNTLTGNGTDISPLSVIAKGEKGDKGDQGIQGVAGAQGPQGEIGPQGIQGIQGVQGVQGPQGENAMVGFNPLGFYEVGKTYNKSTNDLVVNPNNFNNYTPLVDGVTSPPPEGNADEFWIAMVFRGAQGPTGPQGPQGPLGPQGTQGIAGPQGLTGSQGPIGPEGPVGPAGSIISKGRYDTYADLIAAVPIPEAGNWYEVGTVQPYDWYVWQSINGQPPTWDNQGPMKGAKGDTGPKGDTGIQGPAGEQGLQGEKGDTGGQGIQGPQGPQGTEGPPGPAGPTGASGTQGPQGLQGNAGKSAYQSYLDGGGTGTETDFNTNLASIGNINAALAAIARV